MRSAKRANVLKMTSKGRTCGEDPYIAGVFYCRVRVCLRFVNQLVLLIARCRIDDETAIEQQQCKANVQPKLFEGIKLNSVLWTKLTVNERLLMNLELIEGMFYTSREV